jgi:GNAT superfamily N-acetyltransferase
MHQLWPGWPSANASTTARDTWVSGRLDERNNLSRFDCGVLSLNQWLSGRALEAQARGTAATYVGTSPASSLGVAYYAIMPHQVRRDQVSSAMAGGVTVIPAYLLAPLALDVTLHGQGLGAELLHDAMDRIVTAADTASGRLIVDAIDETAAAFYRHHDFQPVRDNPHRLVLKLSTVRKVLGR